MGANTKTCEQCGKSFNHRRGDSAAQWEARRFCSRKCYWDSLLSVQRRPKSCEHCGETFYRPVGRTDIVWEKRRFCGRSCAFAHRQTAFRGRVLERVEVVTDGCWLWKGAVRHPETGRGSVEDNDGRHHYSYRAVYELLVGPIPNGMDLHHTCENPACVNPEHVEPITRAEHNVMTHLGISHEFGSPHSVIGDSL